MDVSVVIPVKDDDRIFECVKSVLACSTEAGALQVIVVENGSLPEFRERLASLPAGAELVCAEPGGAYLARNRGVERASGEVVLFTDADCVVRPGWVREAIAGISGGADLVQGYSGAIGDSPVTRLLQARWEAHLHRIRPGQGTECDTRNLAVRRGVFDQLRFNEKYRRVGDTEFGLLAEARGFRVAYRPDMRVDHAHDPDLRLFAAKQVCHGWGAQRLMQAHPELRWHGGHLRLVSQVVTRFHALTGLTRPGRWLAAGVIAAAGGLERVAPRLPLRVSAALVTAVDKLAGLAGHLMFKPGQPEPSPSQLLHRRVPRD
jgi:hypothetical protein